MTPFNLFVYGTLMAPTVFRAVLGQRLILDPSEAHGPEGFAAREAVLAGYTKVSPDGAYLYAVPDPQGRIPGYVVGPLPPECMDTLLKYEGRNYCRAHVSVQTAEGLVQAVAFVANLSELSHSFGWQFRDRLKQEVLLRGKIEKVLLEEEIDRLKTTEEWTRRALYELHGKTIRDLIRHHFDAGGISNFAISEAIRNEPLREPGQDLLADANGPRLAKQYLSLLVRQVIFNQIEDRIRDEFRFELDRMGVGENFYERTLSALACLRTLNEQGALLKMIVSDMLRELPFGSRKLIDYVRWGILAADRIYRPDQALQEIRFIQNHTSSGALPLGAELEFSNIGQEVIRDPSGKRARDEKYDGFLYFSDFALDILTWKLGGHVDDHRVKSSTKRRRGFFELALGSLSVEQNISKPITDDPWLLNQFIHAALDFYDIAPHSLHLSLQLPSERPAQDRMLPLSVMKCLFALAGDPVRGPDGRVRIVRLAGEEIIRPNQNAQMLFSQVSRRRAIDEDMSADRGLWVQQFKFPRLSPRINYEPIILALKGVQIHWMPGSFLTAPQFRNKPEMAEVSKKLADWGSSAGPLAGAEIEEFLAGVQEGLMHELHDRPAHSQAYIAFCLAKLRASLDEYNAMFVR